ncbi:hypothetical protein PAXRUDRAFT_795399, partial [Paxillus rubicundulus Ve08.2h10]
SDASKNSRNSQASIHSLCSQGTVNLTSLKKSRKPSARWTLDEETAFIDFLISQFSASGDGNPRKATFNEAATLLKKKFPEALGAEKTGDVCRSKWMALKAAYHAVMDIKNTSGFTWSGDQGAGVTLKHSDIWEQYLKACFYFILYHWQWYFSWHPAARPFKNKGFKHFHVIEQMMPGILKCTHIFQPGPTQAGSASADGKLSPPPQSEPILYFCQQ